MPYKGYKQLEEHKVKRSNSMRNSMQGKNQGKNNPMYGKHHTKEARKEIGLAKLGNRHPKWTEEDVGYGALHTWIRTYKPKSDVCESCKQDKPLEAANISGKYKRDVNDFKWLCRKCHQKMDGHGFKKGHLPWNIK